MSKKALLIPAAAALSLYLVRQRFLSAETAKRAMAAGNGEIYDYRHLPKHEPSVLSGKKILFLGSSVTFGAASEGQSFVELFEQLDGVNAIKEAKSGTTLVDQISWSALLFFGNGASYITRLKKQTAADIDCVVCQLSTNDATKNLPLGEISASRELSSFDTSTVTGAMEYIIRFSKDRWNCPVVFYTGSRYDSEPYLAMVRRLYELQRKWQIGIIDLYTDEEFNQIDPETYDLYMYDPIHPTKAGYAQWWMPKMEKELIRILSEQGDSHV